MATGPSYKSKLSVGGTPTAFTGAACTLVSGNTFQINSSTFRVLDPNTARVWKVSGSPVAILSEDLNFGIVTLASSPGANPVTCDGSYIPLAAVAAVKSGDIEETNDHEDTTPINSSGFHQRTANLQDAKVNLEVFDDLNTDMDAGGAVLTFRNAISGRRPMFFEFRPDGGVAYAFRTWLVLDSGKTAFEPNAVTKGSVSGSLAAQGNVNALAGASWGVP